MALTTAVKNHPRIAFTHESTFYDFWSSWTFLLDPKLIAYRYSSSCSCCFSFTFWGRPLQGSVVSNRIGMKFGSNVLQVNAHRLYVNNHLDQLSLPSFRG